MRIDPTQNGGRVLLGECEAAKVSAEASKQRLSLRIDPAAPRFGATRRASAILNANESKDGTSHLILHARLRFLEYGTKVSECKAS
mmetsp:Transcript_38062/g.89119  ORF Transcript_38062/g.89119 Transcript_38062/m.89119 type:complete len:86 (+) Transcript_38062:1627-1884(+)